MGGKVTGVRIDRKPRRMVPEYDIQALESEIAQRYENARVLEKGAEEERKKARQLEQLVQDMRQKNVCTTTYVGVSDDQSRRLHGSVPPESEADSGSAAE